MFIGLFAGPSLAAAADWPMWRYDSGRTATSPTELPAELTLRWVRQYPARLPTWEDPLNQDLMPYDKVFEPVILGKTMFIGFNDADKLAAFDTETGEQRWAIYVGGPVRLPPVAWQGKVYFCSDDGFMYCADAATGRVLWQRRGGPSDKHILGNSRLISMWPARGGAVIQDGILYFAASIWPFMGTFIYAVDAETGAVLWLNDGTGARYAQQPHRGSEAFGSVAPQGAMVVAGDTLLVPGGRSVPAALRRDNGEFLYYTVADYSKVGGSFVCAQGEVFYSHTREKTMLPYQVADGKLVKPAVMLKQPVLSQAFLYCFGPASDGQFERGLTCRRASSGAALPNPKPEDQLIWQIPLAASGGDLIQAGNRLYSCGGDQIAALDLDPDGAAPTLAWTKTIQGTAERLVAADGKLFITTLEGRIYCFGEGKHNAVSYEVEQSQAARQTATGVDQAVDQLLRTTAITDGYALVLGVESGDTLMALALKSKLQLIAVDSDSARVDRLRRRFDAAGLYGRRVHLLVGDPQSFAFPPYLANLVLSEDWSRAGISTGYNTLVQQVFHTLRPYGGTAWFDGCTPPQQRDLVATLDALDLPGAKPQIHASDTLLLCRAGPLPGAASWTHQYGDVANSVKSDDQLVKLPLGLLWFGGSSNMDVLPRHAHGPVPQVIGGRLFIQGNDSLSARDVYTGRVLWKTVLNLDTFDVYYDSTYVDAPLSTAYNQVHIPGANARGTNYVATADRIYIAETTKCRVLDAATGSTAATFTLPATADEPGPDWGYMGVYEDTLIAGAGFVPFRSKVWPEANLSEDEQKAKAAVKPVLDRTASQALVGLDRHSGDVRWQHPAKHGFLHNGIVAGNGAVFCLDRVPPYIAELASRRGRSAAGSYTLQALDLRDGRVIWATTENVFGTWLGYSKEHNILIQGGRPSRDMIPGESGTRIIAYDAATGAVLWDAPHKYANPLMLHGDRIITDTAMLDLHSGKPLDMFDPVTGLATPWTFERRYGCNYSTAAEHMLTFRSGAAGFYDLTGDGGTGNFGGFKSGCTSNLLAADGVLNAPDYTRTCSCAYQNQTSLALVHMPDVEVWTTHAGKDLQGSIQRVGINFGAPGNRRDDHGTYWLEYPDAGAASPQMNVEVQPAEVAWFRNHTSRVDGDGLPWVAASGGAGLSSVKIQLGPETAPASSYLVRLHFAEPEDSVKPGERVFSVQLQDQEVLSNFDIVKETGGARRAITKAFANVQAAAILELKLALAPAPQAGGKPPVLSGIEIFAERIRLEGGYDGRIRFDAPVHFRVDQPFVIRNARLRDATATAGTLYYRLDGAAAFSALPLQSAANGTFSAVLPPALLGKSFAYYLELRADNRALIRVPAYAESLFQAVPDVHPPTAVAEFTMTGATSYEVNLAWQPAQDDDRVVAYQVLEITPDATAETLLAELPATTLSFTHRQVKPHQAVHCLVRAVDGTGRIGPATALQVEVPGNAPPQNNLKLRSTAGMGSAVIQWSGNLEPDVTELHLLRGDSASGPFQPITTITDIKTAVYVDAELEPDRQYWYIIRLRDNGGLASEPSRPIVVTAMPMPEIFVSDLKPVLATAGWEQVISDLNSVRKPITLSGVVYQKGLAAHAKSEIVYDLPPLAERFVALVGIDDINGRRKRGSITARVLADDMVLHESPLLKGGDAPWPIQVTLPPGVAKLTLIITDGGDGIGSDLAVWANAGLVKGER